MDKLVVMVPELKKKDKNLMSELDFFKYILLLDNNMAKKLKKSSKDKSTLTKQKN